MIIGQCFWALFCKRNVFENTQYIVKPKLQNKTFLCFSIGHIVMSSEVISEKLKYKH